MINSSIVDKLQKKFQETLDKFKTTKGLPLSNIEKNLIKNDWNNFLNFDEDEQCSVGLKDKIKDGFSKSYENVAQTQVCKTNLRMRFYNEYFQSHPHRCCFCGQLLEKNQLPIKKSPYYYPMATIEHIFPKDKFPQYALCLNNWVPCCYECNSLEKGTKFFTSAPRKNFHKALQQLGIDKNFGNVPLQIWKNISFDFSKVNGEILIQGKSKCIQNKEAFGLLEFYGLNKRYRAIQRSFYNNLFNLIKCHNINTPEAMETFLESCQTANIQEMISDFSLNNCPKLWCDFLDYVLYDYNNLVALWEEIKEYNKLKYFKV